MSAAPLASAEVPAEECAGDAGRWWLPIALLGGLLGAGALWFLLLRFGPPGGWGAAPVGLWPFFPFVPLLFLLAVILLLRMSWWGSRGWSHPRQGEGSSAREILRARFARGEITSEELRRMAEELHRMP